MTYFLLPPELHLFYPWRWHIKVFCCTPFAFPHRCCLVSVLQTRLLVLPIPARMAEPAACWVQAPTIAYALTDGKESTVTSVSDTGLLCANSGLLCLDYKWFDFFCHSLSLLVVYFRGQWVLEPALSEWWRLHWRDWILHLHVPSWLHWRQLWTGWVGSLRSTPVQVVYKGSVGSASAACSPVSAARHSSYCATAALPFPSFRYWRMCQLSVHQRWYLYGFRQFLHLSVRHRLLWNQLWTEWGHLHPTSLILLFKTPVSHLFSGSFIHSKVLLPIHLWQMLMNVPAVHAGTVACAWTVLPATSASVQTRTGSVPHAR